MHFPIHITIREDRGGAYRAVAVSGDVVARGQVRMDWKKAATDAMEELHTTARRLEDTLRLGEDS